MLLMKYGRVLQIIMMYYPTSLMKRSNGSTQLSMRLGKVDSTKD